MNNWFMIDNRFRGQMLDTMFGTLYTRIKTSLKYQEKIVYLIQDDEAEKK